jgi:DNA-binding transcriptional ArsR family regulator
MSAAGTPQGQDCDQVRAAADMLRALAHPMRLSILRRLLQGEVPVSAFEAELGLKQPSLSQQLAQLREAGLVTTRRESKAIIYRLDDARVAPVLAVLGAQFPTPDDAVAPPASTTPTVRRATPPPAPASPTAPISAPPRAASTAATACGVFARAGWPRI